MPDEKPEKVTPATGAEKPEPLSPAMRAAVRLAVAGAAPIAVYRIAETYPLYAYHHSAPLVSAKVRAFLDFVVALTRA